MGLFDFFKKTTKSGTEVTVNSSELLEGAASAADETEDVETSLSIPAEWSVSKEQEYVLRFLSNDLAPLKKDQLSLSGIDIEVSERSGDWSVQAFLRSSLDKTVSLGKAELLLLDSNGEVAAAQEFDLAELGAIPARTDRPWIFRFKKENIQAQAVPAEGWKLAFNVQSLLPHRLDLDPAWEAAMKDSQKEALASIVSKLPALKPREMNITGFQSSFSPEGNFAVSVLIRNGHSKHIKLEKLPLEVLDASGKQVAAGSFTLNDLEIKANTSKPWTFVFPKEMVHQEKPDLSRWLVRVPAKQTK